MARYCENCGSSLEKGDCFCGSCGVRQQSQSKLTDLLSPPDKLRERRSRIHKLAALIAILSSIPIALGGWYAIRDYLKDKCFDDVQARIDTLQQEDKHALSKGLSLFSGDNESFLSGVKSISGKVEATTWKETNSKIIHIEVYLFDPSVSTNRPRTWVYFKVDLSTSEVSKAGQGPYYLSGSSTPLSPFSRVSLDDDNRPSFGFVIYKDGYWSFDGDDILPSGKILSEMMRLMEECPE